MNRITTFIAVLLVAVTVRAGEMYKFASDYCPGKDSVSLTNMIAGMGTNLATVVLDGGPWSVSNGVVIPSNIELLRTRSTVVTLVGTNTIVENTERLRQDWLTNLNVRGGVNVTGPVTVTANMTVGGTAIVFKIEGDGSGLTNITFTGVIDYQIDGTSNIVQNSITYPSLATNAVGTASVIDNSLTANDLATSATPYQIDGTLFAISPRDNRLADTVASSSYAVVSGGFSNRLGTSFAAPYANINGGKENRIDDAQGATIGGGSYNVISNGYHSAILSGLTNTNNSPNASVIAGGLENRASSGAQAAFIGGGQRNVANGLGAMIPGGVNNVATNYCFAAGQAARAIHDSVFLWADDGDGVADVFNSTAANQAMFRVAGGLFVVPHGSGSTNAWLETGMMFITNSTPSTKTAPWRGAFIYDVGSNLLWMAGTANVSTNWRLVSTLGTVAP